MKIFRLSGYLIVETAAERIKTAKKDFFGDKTTGIAQPCQGKTLRRGTLVHVIHFFNFHGLGVNPRSCAFLQNSLFGFCTLSGEVFPVFLSRFPAGYRRNGDTKILVS